jgi:hypothetical protein
MRFFGDRLAVFGEGGGYYCDESTGRYEPIIPELSGVPLSDAVVYGEYIYLGGPAGLYIAKTNGKKFKLPFGTPVESIGEKKKKRKSALWLVTDEIGVAGVNRIIVLDDIIVVGTTDGVYHYDPDEKEFSRPDIPLGLSGPAVYSLFRDGDRLYAVGGGGLDEISLGDSKIEPIVIASHRTPEVFRDVTEFNGDIVSLGTDTVFRLGGSGLVPVFDFEEAGIAGTGQCLEVFDGNLFVGTTQQFFKLDTSFTIGKDFPGLRARDIVGLAVIGDVLYAATRFDGVYGFASGSASEKLYHIDGYTGLSGEEIISLNSDGENVYVGFYDKGLDILTPQLEFVDNITWGDGLSHTDIFAAAYDPPYLWISIRGVGINAYNLETGEREDIRKYYARYGLGDEYCRDIEVLGPGCGYDHRIAFATASGVSILCYESDTPPNLTVGDVDKGYR